MYKYRIYLKEENETIHEELFLTLPTKICIGETVSYSEIFKVIDIIHYVSKNQEFITDLICEKNSMSEDLKTKIEEYLSEGERWKMFIEDSANDYENATLISLSVSIQKETNINCELSIDISYNISEEEEKSTQENGIAKFSKPKNDLIITDVKKY
jgi:hypothetical protein